MNKKLIAAPLSILFALSMFAGVPERVHASDADSPLQLAKAIVTAASSGKISAASIATTLSTNALVTKAYVLDPLAWVASQLSLQAVIQSTLNWVGSGFNGSPAFVTDLPKLLQTKADTAALAFTDQLRTNNSINSPFQDALAQAVRTTYLRSTGSNGFFDTNQFTLNQVSQNPEAFLKGDFSQGGFNAWFRANEPQNNFRDSYLRAVAATEGVAAGAKETEKTQLSWAGGVRSYKGKCESASKTASSTALSLTSIDPCLFSSIITPGSQILNAANKAGVAGLDKLISAKSLDEVASSFLTNILLNALKHGSGAAASGNDSSSVPVGSSATGTLSTDPTDAIGAIVSNQITVVTDYQRNWQAIQAAATTAQSCSSDASIRSTLDSATTALGKAAGALTALNRLQSDIRSIGGMAVGTETAAFQDVASSYSALFTAQPPILPTPAEITEASDQSKPGTIDGTPTLLSQMQAFSASCGSGT